MNYPSVSVSIQGFEGIILVNAYRCSRRLGQDARKYDSRDGIGRVESGTETENNAGAVIEAQGAQRKNKYYLFPKCSFKKTTKNSYLFTWY